MPHLVCESIGNLVLVLQGEERQSRAEFEAMLGAWEAAFEKHDYRIRSIVIADEGPSAKERRECAEVGWGRGTSRAVVVTNSMPVRGIVTALGWLGVPLRAAAPGSHFELFRTFLELSAAERDEIDDAVVRLRPQLSGRAPSVDQYIATTGRRVRYG